MRIKEFPVYDTPVDRFKSLDAPGHAKLAKFIIANSIMVAIDTETYYDPELRAVVRFVQGSPNNRPFCMTLTYVSEDGEYNSFYAEQDCITMYKDMLYSGNVAKILHNAKYDMHMLMNIGLEVRGKIWDTMLMIHLIDEEHVCNTPSGGKVESKKLKDLAYHYLGEDGHKYEDLVDEVRHCIALRRECAKNLVSYKDAADACPLIMKDYACSDTEFTYQLFVLFYEELVKQELLEAYDVDFNATMATLYQERDGILVDIDYFDAVEAELQANMDETTALIIELIPKGLNINSGRDLVEGFATLGLTWRWYTEKGEVKTDDKILRNLNNLYVGTPLAELASLIMQYRESSKLVGTFIAQIRQFTQWDGRIHPNFNVSPRDDGKGGTVTGRLSSSDPNLQNMPKDDKRIRKGIIPTPGYVFVEMDYSQQEYRLLAHYAQDRNFMQIVHDGKDIHAGTAELLLHVSMAESMMKKYRDVGKRLNFALVYGLGLAALAASLGLKIDEPTYKKASFFLRNYGCVPWGMPTLDIALNLCHNEGEKEIVTYYYSDEAKGAIAEAERIKSEYFRQFPQIQDFLKACINTAKYRGWIKTWTGRRRHFKNPKADGYKAPNALIQGGCGDITKIKMWECVQYLKPYKSRLINNIHDALLFEIHKSEMRLIPELAAIMKDLDFSVPMDCSIEMSEKSWGDMKDYEYEQN